MHAIVAVYGTLKRGFSNSHLLDHAEFLGLDILNVITLYDLGPYPAAREEPSQGIAVEVFAVTAEQLELLDELEGYFAEAPEAGLYDRKQFPTRYGAAWVYIYNHQIEGFRQIKSGAWQPGL
jgi:gamma-glutamylcyclotransferase (GGCT)/AIG2-like uncharacterized protein YtfP